MREKTQTEPARNSLRLRKRAALPSSTRANLIEHPTARWSCAQPKPRLPGWDGCHRLGELQAECLCRLWPPKGEVYPAGKLKEGGRSNARSDGGAKPQGPR